MPYRCPGNLRLLFTAVLVLFSATACTDLCTLSLSSCAPRPVDASLRKPCQAQARYLQQITSARLHNTTLPATTSNLPLCQRSQPQPVIVLTYTATHKETIHHAAAPFDLNAPSPDFPWLEELLSELQNTRHTLQDVNLRLIPIKQPAPENTTPETLEKYWQSLHRRADHLTPLEEARVNLRLIHFLMDHHYRDAAYLTVENTKEALANATRQFPDQAALIAAYVKELETLESDLKTRMPFRL